MSLIAELKRRKVFKVGAAYAVVAWVAIQVGTSVLPLYGTPEWFLRAFILVLMLGFPVALVMAWMFDVTPEGVKLDASATGTKRIMVSAVVLAALAVGWYFHGRPRLQQADVSPPSTNQASTNPAAATTSATSATAPPAVSATDPNSIAVLPFVDMSQAHDQEYFSDGLSEELLNQLAQLPQLRVIARTSSFSFKGREVDVAEIAKALNVAHVLEGSVRKDGNTLRITAQLIRTSDSSHLWSQTYDRKLTDIFKVQDEIAGAVVDALKVKLLPNQDVANPHTSSNPAAYSQLLLGNQFFNQQNPANWRHAVDAYRRAIALDPNYAAAYAGLAQSEGYLADRAGDPNFRQQALADADKAVALAPELADGYLARGINRLAFNNDLTGTQADLEKAIALNPGDSAVQIGYGRLLIALGKLPEAIANARHATALDPLSGLAWSQLGRLLTAAGQYAEARKALNRATQISPDADYTKFHLGEMNLLDGKPQDALAIFRNTASEYGLAGIAMAEHSLGHTQQSQQALDEEITKNAKGAAYQIAEAYAWRGEKDKAFEWLERARVQHDGGLSFIKLDPLLAHLKGDPRFPAFLKKMGVLE